MGQWVRGGGGRRESIVGGIHSCGAESFEEGLLAENEHDRRLYRWVLLFMDSRQKSRTHWTGGGKGGSVWVECPMTP